MFGRAVEQRSARLAHNQEVGGSNPPGATNRRGFLALLVGAPIAAKLASLIPPSSWELGSTVAVNTFTCRMPNGYTALMVQDLTIRFYLPQPHRVHLEALEIAPPIPGHRYMLRDPKAAMRDAIKACAEFRA